MTAKIQLIGVKKRFGPKVARIGTACTETLDGKLPTKSSAPRDGPTARRGDEVTPISIGAASARLTSSGVSGIRSLCDRRTAP